MRFMQRITWSGIALHRGRLPAYPASHDCLRMPLEFAEHLFGVTKIGMRVVVAPNDQAPIDLSHPVLATLSRAGATNPSARAVIKGSRMLHSIATEKAAEAGAATERADAARLSPSKRRSKIRGSRLVCTSRIRKVMSRSPADSHPERRTPQKA